MGRVLGQGSFATVKLATCKADNTKWAIKVIKRSCLAPEDEQALATEVAIMERVKHPNVISLKEVFDCPTHMYMVMEIMSGGELFDRIVQKEHYSELEAKEALRQIVSAIGYCHDMGIVHRDLKPENLLYTSPSPDAALKLADFGLAQLLKPNELMHSACGTPGYVAPEVLRNDSSGYGKEVDMWSIGVILYILICGFPPFYDEDNAKLFVSIQKGEYDYPSPYWDSVSPEVTDLIDKLLVLDPGLRLTAAQTLEHPWLTASSQSAPLPHFAPNMKAFNARRRMRGAMRVIQLATSLQKVTA